MSAIPAVRAKYPGRSLEQAFRRDPLAYDARFVRDRATGIDHWAAKRRYLGRQRAIQHRIEDSTELAQERSDLRPVDVDVRESRQKAALCRIGAAEGDQERTEEYALAPIDPAAQYRAAAVRPTPPRCSQDAKGGEHHDLGQVVASRAPFKKRNGRAPRRRRRRRGPLSGPAASSSGVSPSAKRRPAEPRSRSRTASFVDAAVGGTRGHEHRARLRRRCEAPE